MILLYVVPLLGAFQLSISQDVTIGLVSARETVNEGDEYLTLCTRVMGSTVSSYNANVSVVYQDRSAVGKIY